MIRRSNEYNVEKRVIANGNGEAVLHHKFTQDELFGKCRLCAEINLEPGQSIGEHAHENEFELFYMLRGELVSCGEGKPDEPFLPGDIMVTGYGDKHSLRNDGGETATIFAIITND